MYIYSKYVIFILTLLSMNISYSQILDKKEDFSRINTSNCDFCLCYMGISPLDFSGKGIRIDTRYLLLDRLVNNNRVVDNTEESYEKHFTLQLSLIYPVGKKISVIGIVPYSVREGRESAEEKTSYTSGLGDIILFGRYPVLEKLNVNSIFLLSAQLGIKLPNGKPDEKNSANELIDAHLQIGTGSTDFIGGSNFLYSHKRFSISSNLLFSVKTRGKTGYKFGNTFNYDITSKYMLFQSSIGKNMFFINTGIKGDLRGKESQNGILISNSGGNTLFLTGGFNYFLSPYVSLEAQFMEPVLYTFNGIQDAESFKFVTGIQFMFY